MANYPRTVLMLAVTLMVVIILIDLGSVGVAAQGGHWEYIVVGAGPAGLQLGYFLKRAGRDYVILERANISGSFFTMYPRHGRLISINKRHTGRTNKEFNLRHDWNSLLSDDESLLFTKYSRELFPDRDRYVEYLADYQQKLEINVIHNTDVHNITQTNERMNVGGNGKEIRFRMQDLNGNIFTCKTLIIATGMWSPRTLPKETMGEEYVEGYETVSVNPDDFEGQSVLILGRGNAAFEVADRIYGSTNYVHMIGRSRVRLSWSTHYVGDLRGVNNAPLDTYQLKSLDAMLEAPLEGLQITRNGSRYSVSIANHTTMYQSAVTHDNFALREPYDRIIRCLGFHFNDSLFSRETIRLSHGVGRKVKYPKIEHNFESIDVPGMFFLGTVAHSLDFRKSAGGFVHGFRYSARTLHHLLEHRNHAKLWPSRVGHITDLLPLLVKRVNEASGLYQMYRLLCDVIALRGETFEYFEEFPTNLLHDFEHHTGKSVSEIIVVTLQYGANFSGPGKDTFRLTRATGEPSEASRSNFLHPVLYYYKHLPTKKAMRTVPRYEFLPRPDRLHHMVEDFLTAWDAPLSHVLPLRRFLEHSTGKDLRQFFAEDCLQLAMTHSSLPEACRRQFGIPEPANGAGCLGNAGIGDGCLAVGRKTEMFGFSLPLSVSSM